MPPCVEIYWLYRLSIELPSFAHIFFSFVSLSVILAECLIRLKNITREFWKFDDSEIYFVLTYPRGYEKEGLGGVCESEIGNPLASVEMSLAPN